jgi:alpha-glucosidase
VYQGEELGLPEVEDLPPEHIQDPMHYQSGGTDPGRDGCRVPLPWTGDAQPYGFGPPGSTPWLPQPTEWTALTVAAQDGDPSSMLSLYRTAIALRRQRLDRHTEALRWIDAGDGVLAFRRGDVACVVNLSPHSVHAPAGTVLLSSADLDGGRIPTDTTAWIELTDSQRNPDPTPDPEQQGDTP